MIIVNFFLYFLCTILGMISGNVFTLTLREMLPNITIQLFYVAITLPIYLVISYKFYRVFNIVFIMIIMIISSMLFNCLENEKLQALFDVTSGGYGLIFGIIALIISLIVSLIIYKKSEVK